MDTPSNLDFNGEDSDNPMFYRLNSEVVEKPSSSDERLECFAYPSSSSPASYQGHVSPAHSSVKAENELGESWWPVVPSWCGPEEEKGDTVSGHDGLLALSLCVTGGLSDSESEAQGDVDEGFDEEFEERDLNESDNNNRHHQQHPFQIEDLDPKELQQLLGMESGLAALEDFDLGVDVLDNDHEQSILSPLSVGSSVSHVTSPAHAVASLTSSPSPSIDIHVQAMQRNILNQTNECPAAIQRCGNGDEREAKEEMVQYDEQLATFVSECGVEPNHTPYDQAHLMDLTETFALAEVAALPPTSDSPSTDLHSMLLFGNGSGHLSFLPPNSTTVGHVTSMTTLMDSSMFPTLNSLSSAHVDEELHGQLSLGYRHPPPAASPTSVTTSPPPSPSPSLEQDVLTAEERKLVDIPYYQFRKLLDDPSVSDKKKEVIKNVRRKGKNKAAAKVCRQKKVHKIKGLEEEIEQLKRTKQLMAFRSKSLEREIAQFKRQCHSKR